MLKKGREELAQYPSIELQRAYVLSISPDASGFAVDTDDGKFHARRVILAMGISDHLPQIDGFEEGWGVTVLHCPFCHGWEARDQALAVYGNGPSALELALMARNWSSQVTLCTGGPADLSSEDRARLARHGISVREERVMALDGTRVIFEAGEPLPYGSVFVRPNREPNLGFARMLGCEVSEDGYLVVDAEGKTTVKGVFGAGDAIEPKMQILTFAAFSGARAGIGAVKSLLEEDFA